MSSIHGYNGRVRSGPRNGCIDWPEMSARHDLWTTDTDKVPNNLSAFLKTYLRKLSTRDKEGICSLDGPAEQYFLWFSIRKRKLKNGCTVSARGYVKSQGTIQLRSVSSVSDWSTGNLRPTSPAAWIIYLLSLNRLLLTPDTRAMSGFLI